MYLLVIKQLAIMIFLAVAGFIVTKSFKFGMREQQFVSKILIYFINPCLILSRFDMEFDFSNLKSFGIVLLLSIVVYLVMIAVALLFFRSKNEEESRLIKLISLALFLQTVLL